MKIKDVEELLGITRANIRYYEKEGLLTVERKDNKYREYTEADISTLKRIIVLRKTGVSVEEIKALFEGRAELSKVMDTAISRLEKKRRDLKGALRVADKIKKEGYAAFDEEFYFGHISREEQKGGRFIDLCTDISDVETDIFDKTIRFMTRWDFKDGIKKAGAISAVLLLLILLLVRAFVGSIIWGDDFWTLFFNPFIVFLLVSAIILPIYLISRKFPKAAGILYKVLVWFGILFLSAIALYVIVSLVKIGIEKL